MCARWRAACSSGRAPFNPRSVSLYVFVYDGEQRLVVVDNPFNPLGVSVYDGEQRLVVVEHPLTLLVCLYMMASSL